MTNIKNQVNLDDEDDDDDKELFILKKKQQQEEEKQQQQQQKAKKTIKKKNSKKINNILNLNNDVDKIQLVKYLSIYSTTENNITIPTGND